MALTLNTRTYDADRYSPDSVSYTGPAHTFSNRDTAELKRVNPKPTKDFLGVAKPTFKLTKTFTLSDGTKKDAIVMLSGSLPVGMTSIQTDSLLADIAAFAASTSCKDLFFKLDVNN